MPVTKYDEFNEALDENKKEKQSTPSTFQHRRRESLATE